MARLLVTNSNLNVVPGIILSIRPDGFRWGRKEDVVEWIKAGNDPNKWHNKFVCVDLPGVDYKKAEQFLVNNWKYNHQQKTFIHANGQIVTLGNMIESLKCLP